MRDDTSISLPEKHIHERLIFIIINPKCTLLIQVLTSRFASDVIRNLKVKEDAMTKMHKRCLGAIFEKFIRCLSHLHRVSINQMLIKIKFKI